MGTSFRVHWALHEMGLAYEKKSVDFKANEHRSPAYLALNPMGQVPLIDVDGFVLPESLAPENRRAFSWARSNPVGALRAFRHYPAAIELAATYFLLCSAVSLSGRLLHARLAAHT